MDSRASILLKTLVEHYIAEGQPIGSRSLSKFSGLELSPASIRNIMSDLEDDGLIASPHTSSGRIPTTLGYRFFVDTLLTLQPPQEQQISTIVEALQNSNSNDIVSTASQILSELTHYAGIILLPAKNIIKIHQIEFIKLSEHRLLLILVTFDGEVQNRIIKSEHNYQQEELNKLSQYLNEHYCGLDLAQIRSQLERDIQNLRSDIKPLLENTLIASCSALSRNSTVIIHGEKNFLDLDDFAGNIKKIRQLFDLFEQRMTLIDLLDRSQQADGVQIYIGQESGIESLQECSVVLTSYEKNGEFIGSLGVIGPSRMAYDKVISLVEITSQFLSSAISG